MAFITREQARQTIVALGLPQIVLDAFDGMPQGFFRFAIESPVAEEHPGGLSWQQVLVKEFKFLWEMEWTDERLREVAGWFGFKSIDLRIAELSTAELDTCETDSVWYHSFLEKVGGR